MFCMCLFRSVETNVEVFGKSVRKSGDTGFLDSLLHLMLYNPYSLILFNPGGKKFFVWIMNSGVMQFIPRNAVKKLNYKANIIF